MLHLVQDEAWEGVAAEEVAIGPRLILPPSGGFLELSDRILQVDGDLDLNSSIHTFHFSWFICHF